MSTDPRQTPIPSTFKSAARNGDPYTPYTPLPGGVPAPQFPTGALPKTVEKLVTEAAAAIGCPPDTIALSALTTLGSAIGNSRVIHMKKGWREGAAIYAAVIADSGEKKTAAIAVATDPAQKRQNELNKEYEKALDEFTREEREYEVEKKEAAEDGLPEPEPLTDAEQRELGKEPVSGGEDWYLDMLTELRAEIPDDHPKAEVMDRAIALESKDRAKGRTDEEPTQP